MNVVLMGPPGAGKGTQADLIKGIFPLAYISTGDIFREAVSKQTSLGLEAQKYMVEGKLVPDEVTIGIVRERLVQPDCQAGFLLDGFPRTVKQAVALNEALADMNRSIDVVINISVPDEILVSRISGRVSCNECKMIYNLVTNPPQHPGVCDKCGHKLEQRNDDQRETVIRRLKVYGGQTKLVLGYFDNRGLLFDIDGCRDSGAVFEDIRSILKKVNYICGKAAQI